MALVVMAGVGCGSEKQAAAPATVDEVLALVNDTGRSHQTIAARVTYWSDEALIDRVLDRRFGESRDRGVVALRSATSLRVWIERPDRCRSEASGETAVADGKKVWRDFRGTKNVMVQDQPNDASVWCAGDMFADPASVLEGLTLSLDGEENVRGRSVVALHGDPKPSAGDASGVSRAGLGDRHRVLIDLETGLPVGIESFFEGKPLERTTVEELSVGTSIPDEIFTYVPAPDARVLDNESLQPAELSLADAASRVPFPLWVPAGFDEVVSAAPDLLADTDFVMFAFGGAFPVSAKESVAVPLAGDGRRMVREGIEILVVREAPPGSATVALIRDGTRIELTGAATPEKLADLALSFQPVPKP